MPKQTPEVWNPRPLNDADRQLVSGGLVRPNKCTDPISASLFLGLRAKQRLETVRINKRPKGLKALLWNLVRARQEARLAFGTVAATYFSSRNLHSFLTRKIYEFGSAKDRVGDSVQLSVPELSMVVVPEILADRDFIDLIARMRSSGSTVLLQGSQADRKVTNFSDFDFVIFGDMFERTQRSLKREFDQMLIRFDPLQHHGSFFIDLTYMDCYWESLLPIASLRQSVAIGHPATLNLRPLSEVYGAINSLQGIVNAWEAFLSNPEIVRGMWDWKYKVSQFLLIPTLVLAAGGVFASKADSFDLCQGLFSNEAWQSVEKLTSVRASWPPKEAFSRYRDVVSRADGWILEDFEPVPLQEAVWRIEEFRHAATRLLVEARALVYI